MKRVLAYLFIVLGLGLVFSKSSSAATKGMCVIKKDKNYYVYRPNSNNRKCSKQQLIDKKTYPIQYKNLYKHYKQNNNWEIAPNKSINKAKLFYLGEGTFAIKRLKSNLYQPQKETKKIAIDLLKIKTPNEPKANQIILINSNTNQILYEKNADQKINPAGFTKIMTSIIVFDAIKNGQISLKDKLRVSKKAWKISTSGYSAMFVMNGDSISVENLLRGLIVASGNDAAIVLAEGLAGSENNFVKLMNDKAKRIGLNYTKFGNSTGIIIPTNTTTVKDVAIMSSYLINNYPELYYFFGEKQFTWNRTGGDPITQGNRNPLLYKNMNVDGLRTSYNQTDRYGLASSMYLKNNDDRLIVVGSGFKDKNDRARESAKLLTFGKTNYHIFKIAKKEPAATPKKKVKVVETKQVSDSNISKYNFCILKKDNFGEILKEGFPVHYTIQLSKCNKRYEKKDFDEFIEIVLTKRLFNLSSYSFRGNLDNLLKSFKINNLELDRLVDSISTNAKFTVSQLNYVKLVTNYKEQTQIVKTEPTVKPKKKVEVAKVEEPKQEEFKPKKTNQDNEAPVIEIAEVITVNDTDYEFQGKVTDQAKTIYVEVDGRPTDVKSGKFIVKGYSPIDKQISIEAIDQWGNRSEPKIIKLKIDIKDTSIAEKLEPLNPSKIRSKSSNDKVALIIGIENYLESPNAKYANLDAKYFFDYARKGFGVKKQNINLLVDEDATFVKTNKALTKWLRSKIKSGQSDLIIFFAGHGLASNDGKELYLLPQDSDPDLLSRTALSRTELFQEIVGLNPNSVTMFLDTCYSGVSRDEKMLLASARPIRIVSNEEQDVPDNFTIFSASQLDQISSGIKEAKHGIFSYYLMKGLEGYADANKDKNITNGELLAYMDENVSQKASELGRQQNPSLAGDPNKVLMSYR